jgi:hypothetical protein
MGQGAEDGRISARAVARGVLSRWGIRIRFGQRAENRRGPEITPASARHARTEREALAPSAPEGSQPRADKIHGIFSHAEPTPVAARQAPAPEAREEPPRLADSTDDRPRHVTIVDTQVRRRTLRGSLGVVLGWSNEALNAGAKIGDASLTVMRVSIDLHLRTRAARVDYAKTFSFAMGRELGPARTTPIARAERVAKHAAQELRHETPPYRALTVPVAAPATANGHRAQRSAGVGYGPGN